jgi:hypothetical protein
MSGSAIIAWSRRNGGWAFARAEALIRKAAVARVKKTVQFQKRHSTPLTGTLTSRSLLPCFIIVYQWFAFKLFFYSTVGSWVNRCWGAEDSWQLALR